MSTTPDPTAPQPAIPPPPPPPPPGPGYPPTFPTPAVAPAGGGFGPGGFGTGPGGEGGTGQRSDAIVPLLLAAAAGGAVSLALGTYGRVHNPTHGTITTFGFPNVLSMKAWLATGVFVLALAQLTSALAMWGHLPGVHTAPAWLKPVHRWTGTAAFVLSLPVAYHCLWSLGFQDTDTRVLIHSLVGCTFYGAFVTKLLALRIERLPRLALPVLGGLLVTCLTVMWLTSSLWFFQNVGFPGV
jgi:hypothetical protein